MEIRYDFTGQERDAALSVLASHGKRDAALLMLVMTAGSALSMVWPFAMDMPGITRASMGALGSAVMFMLVRKGMDLAERYRRYEAGLPLDPGYMRGVEPGARTVSLSLDGVSEKGPFGRRFFPWASVLDVVANDDLAALVISRQECVVIPRRVLERSGHGDLEVIATLVRHAREG